MIIAVVILSIATALWILESIWGRRIYVDLFPLALLGFWEILFECVGLFYIAATRFVAGS
jgi:hypothetical protein